MKGFIFSHRVLVSNKRPQCCGRKASWVVLWPSDKLAIEESVQWTAYCSKCCHFRRSWHLQPLEERQRCHHSSSLSNPSGVWNIKLEYIISKRIILGKSTPNRNSFSQPFFNKKVTALLGPDSCLPALSLFSFSARLLSAVEGVELLGRLSPLLLCVGAEVRLWSKHKAS